MGVSNHQKLNLTGESQERRQALDIINEASRAINCVKQSMSHHHCVPMDYCESDGNDEDA